MGACARSVGRSPPALTKCRDKNGWCMCRSTDIIIQLCIIAITQHSCLQNDISTGNSALHNFLLAQIKLFVMMCKGNNISVIEVLQGSPGSDGFGVNVNFSLLMSAINDQKLKKRRPELRALLLDLLKGL